MRYLSGRQAMGRGEPAPVAAKLQKAVMIERGAGELEAEAEAETEGAAETQRACPNGARLQLPRAATLLAAGNGQPAAPGT